MRKLTVNTIVCFLFRHPSLYNRIPSVGSRPCNIFVLLVFCIVPFTSATAAPAIDPPDLNIVFTRTLVSTPDLSQNETSVAVELDSLCASTANIDLLGQCSTLDTFTDEEVTQTLREIAPDEIPVQGSGTLEVAVSQINNIRMRLQTLRTDAPPIALNGLLFDVAGTHIPANTFTDPLLGSAASADGLLDNRFGIFVNGTIGLGDKDTTVRELGYDFKVHGITGGADYRVSDEWVIGGALAYANTDSDFTAAGGHHEGDAWTLSAYGSYYPTEDIYVDWIVNYGINDYKTTRNINTLGASTQGDTKGDQWSVSLNLGTDFRKDAWTFSPYGSIEFIDATIDVYTEKGGNGLALQFGGQNINSLMLAVGGRASLVANQSWGVLNPSVYAEWIHEFEDDARQITSRFAVNPSSSFSAQSDEPDRDYMNIGFSLAATFAQGKMGFISLETVLGQDDVERYQLFVGIRIEL